MLNEEFDHKILDLCRLIEQNGDQRVVITTTGQLAQRIALIMLRNGIEIAAFTERNTDLIGNSINGIPIVSLQAGVALGLPVIIGTLRSLKGIYADLDALDTYVTSERCYSIYDQSIMLGTSQLMPASIRKLVALRRHELEFGNTSLKRPYQGIKRLNSTISKLKKLLQDHSIPSMPRVLTIQNTYYCNLRCPHCETHGTADRRAYYNSKAMNQPVNEVYSIAEEVLPYAEDLNLSSSGEPLATTDFDSYVELARKYGCRMSFSTNGTVYRTNEIAKLLSVAGNLNVSLDGASKKVFETLRPGANFEKVLRTITVLANVARQLPEAVRPRIAINFLVMGSNIRDMVRIVELAHQLGVTTINSNFVDIYFESIAGERVQNYQHLYNAQFSEAQALAKKYGITLGYLPPFQAPAEDKLIDQSLIIGSDFTDQDFTTPIDIFSMLDRDEIRTEILSVTMQTLDMLDLQALENLYESSAEENNRLINQNLPILEDIIAKHGPTIIKKINSESNIKWCEFIDSGCYIDNLGRMFSCCGQHNPPLGDYRQTPIRSLFNGPAYMHMKDFFYGGKTEC